MSVKVLDRPQPAEVERSEWKPGSRIAVPAQVAATEFLRLHEQYGRVTPANVVDAARPKKAPLHDCFEWDNTTAAAAYREQQAMHLLRSLVVVYKKADGTLAPPIRGFIKVVPRPEDADEPRSDAASIALEPRVYVPVAQAMSEDALRRRYVQQALRDLITWRSRYKDIAEFARLFALIDELRKEHAG